MIFENSPFELINKAFKTLYPEKEYRACIEPDITDDQGEKAYGITIFYEDETPIVAISAELAIKTLRKYLATNWPMWQQEKELDTEKNGKKLLRTYARNTRE